jgi:hypothetical protein
MIHVLLQKSYSDIKLGPSESATPLVAFALTCPLAGEATPKVRGKYCFALIVGMYEERKWREEGRDNQG